MQITLILIIARVGLIHLSDCAPHLLAYTEVYRCLRLRREVGYSRLRLRWDVRPPTLATPRNSTYTEMYGRQC